MGFVVEDAHSLYLMMGSLKIPFESTNCHDMVIRLVWYIITCFVHECNCTKSVYLGENSRRGAIPITRVTVSYSYVLAR
jgi:5-keto 4-deoxyuronate isomerase